MLDKLGRLIKLVYKDWKEDKQGLRTEEHPDEEDIACFLENRLSQQDCESIKRHLINCERCSEVLAIQIRLKPAEIKKVPQELLERVKGLVTPEDKASVLEIWLKLKQRALEILSTTGDVLVGQELVPAPVLRSRKIKDFQDEVTILKDFKDIRVEAKIENKGGQAFSLNLVVKEKTTQRIMKDLRATLIKDDLELESYLTSTGKVTFEHVLVGKYTIEISNIESKLASILLDIKV